MAVTEADRRRLARLTIQAHFDLAVATAVAEVEALARQALLRNPTCVEFVMAMGAAMFTRRDDEESVSLDAGSDIPASMEPLAQLLADWDPWLHLTGHPMRFTATGPVVTDW